MVLTILIRENSRYEFRVDPELKSPGMLVAVPDKYGQGRRVRSLFLVIKQILQGYPCFEEMFSFLQKVDPASNEFITQVPIVVSKANPKTGTGAIVRAEQLFVVQR